SARGRGGGVDGSHGQCYCRSWSISSCQGGDPGPGAVDAAPGPTCFPALPFRPTVSIIPCVLMCVHTKCSSVTSFSQYEAHSETLDHAWTYAVQCAVVSNHARCYDAAHGQKEEATCEHHHRPPHDPASGFPPAGGAASGHRRPGRSERPHEDG